MGLASWVGIDGRGESRAPILLRPIFPRLRQKCFRRRCQCHCHCQCQCHCHCHCQQCHCLKFQQTLPIKQASIVEEHLNFEYIIWCQIGQQHNRFQTQFCWNQNGWKYPLFKCDMSQNKPPIIYAILLIISFSNTENFENSRSPPKASGGRWSSGLRQWRVLAPCPENTHTLKYKYKYKYKYKKYNNDMGLLRVRTTHTNTNTNAINS